MDRSSGILMPVFSLPGRYGIGCLSGEAYRFVDFLKEAGQTYWQILPLCPTGYGDSPYQSFSTFAGNPYFLSPDALLQEGLLTQEECDAAAEGAGDAGKVDYGKLYRERPALLQKAFGRSRHEETAEYHRFCQQNAFWLEDYALFMACKEARGGLSLFEWEESVFDRDSETMVTLRAEYEDAVRYHKWVQFTFDRQWKALKDYANAAGIRIIGDIPIYVSADSADFWAHRELFQLDERGRIRMVAGVPPDGFSADGQLWGNPLYDWAEHARTGYDWWIRRINKCRELYDVIRIDHFRGFDEYFAIPAEDVNAARGHWEKGPGMDLFGALRTACGEPEIIAEDLGYVTDTVRQLVRDTGFPNMKVLEFAFDSRDSTGRMEYLPYRFGHNCAVYTGTHDNETLRGWMDSILPEELAEARAYLAVMTDDPEEFIDKMLRMAQSSAADLCVIPLQDYLGLDNSARINKPSTQGSNWCWRVAPAALSSQLAGRIREMTRLYGR